MQQRENRVIQEDQIGTWFQSLPEQDIFSLNNSEALEISTFPYNIFFCANGRVSLLGINCVSIRWNHSSRSLAEGQRPQPLGLLVWDFLVIENLSSVLAWRFPLCLHSMRSHCSAEHATCRWWVSSPGEVTPLWLQRHLLCICAHQISVRVRS